ncbi:MAG TPA: MGMT family protein, partial [Acidimicrobiia bacterium]|nr:MGMT family protein [Acidimicrobiia bacterium]
DMHGIPRFHQRVYEAARAVPVGTTVTYGELAARVGSPASARAVGQAMAANPFPIVVPCHRVLSAGGRLGGFSATGGLATKRRMLAIEGVVLRA